MESKLIGWSHLLFTVLAVSLHRSSHAQSATSSTWPGTTLKEALNRTHFGVILVAFLSSIVFLIFFSLLIRQCVDTCATTRTHIISAAVTDHRLREVIHKCPVLVYSDVNNLRIGNSALECAVCLSEFDDSDKIRLLPKCNHVFHPDCIDTWFASSLTCPVCRAKLTPSDSTNNAGADADAVTESSNYYDESSAADSEQRSVESPGPTAERIGVDDGSVICSTGLPAETEPPIRLRTVAERLGRSHSTGHCLFMESEEVMERYTLRLPEHVREEIFGKNQRRVRRCASSNDVVLRGEWSSKKGRDNNMERWVLLGNMTPPFVSRDWNSVKFVKLNSDQRSLPPLRPPV